MQIAKFLTINNTLSSMRTFQNEEQTVNKWRVMAKGYY
ncbi:hypothetical protein wTpre_395 [Wolbachia endosymbiont of Trichogramma pretiosum]|nr:hypothetical protein wTpre_395 [Wolbachia endosymbiont of Trichogramma pretiosum]